jgi:cytochrome c-type biogenesis protein CcmF
VTVLMATLDFFLLLLIFAKRPFDTFLTAAPTVGKGLNPLLQDAYMAFHPPSLYIGLVGCAVPFAFGMAALITGNLDDSWLRSVRRWVLVSWFFLSLGLVLGMLWAYHVLGWGGYWGWDPVENAGSLAWFTNTAFLHSILVQERRGMLKVWNVFLVIASFLLTMLATFLTRSGIVQSVHAFGSDPVLKVSFLAFIVFSGVLAIGLLIYRLPLLRSRGELDSWVSREFMFLVNNWILLAAALFILIATLFPSLSDWITGTRVNLATPFYTQWMTPIGLILLVLTGVGPLIAWRRATPTNLAEQFAIPVGFSVVVVAALLFVPGATARTPIFTEKLQLPIALVNFGLCGFVIATIAQEFYRGARVRQAHTKLDFITSLIGLVARNKRRYGGYIIHVAIVLMFIGFGGGAYKKETEVTLEKGQHATLGRYAVQFKDLRAEETLEKRIVAADVVIYGGVKSGDKERSLDGLPVIGHAEPAKWYFPNHEEEPVTHVEIRTRLDEDLYLVLNGYDPEAHLINLKIVVNPLVNWIWLGFALLAIGTVIAISPERAYVVAGAKERTKAAASTAALGLLLGLSLIGGAARAADTPAGMGMGHDQSRAVRAAPRSPAEDELFHKIVCMCGTCGRQLLADCTCSTAAKMRADISKMVADGKSVDEVIAHYLKTYEGESALAMPIDKGFNRLAWVLPYAAFLIGLGALGVAAKRLTRRHAPAVAPLPPRAADDKRGDDDYEAKLDDELDNLD